MTFDELDQKIIAIKKKGLNILIENEMIADVRGKYYTNYIDKKLNHITQRVRSNVKFMNSLHKNSISNSKIQEFMGLEPEYNFNKIIYDDGVMLSLKTALLISEYYGLPIEIFLFQDLEANAETLKQLYPAFLRQSRN